MTPDRALGFSREGDIVTLRMTVSDWENLLIEIGMAGGLLHSDRNLFYRHFAFLNRLNAGNPRWKPYEIPEEIPE